MDVKIKFKSQKFQNDAAKSVCGIFSGQPNISSLSYEIDIANEHEQIVIPSVFAVWGNHKIDLTDETLLENLQNVQEQNNIIPSENLGNGYNFTVEMETGTGKTYTYIKTIYELNRIYGWSKFIIVVPSIAIREGVYKTFQITDDHFAAEYNKRADYFIYDSSNLARLNSFVSDSGINIMIINSQAFNSTGQDAKRIRMEMDSFQSFRPLDVVACTRPIMIIDEPQSVEGPKTKESLKDFRPLFVLRYSATPREKYHMIYKLDAIDAYNERLVKKICVTGISVSNVSASGSYIYLRGIIKSKRDPVALIEHDIRRANGIKRITHTISEGSDLYEKSGGLEEYKNGFVIKTVDGLNGRIEFLNGVMINSGEIYGNIADETVRRVQIRETIEAHLRKERQLFSRGIKVLSLFFIDEVSRYRIYNEEGEALNGIYAKIFEEEYREAVKNFQVEISGEKYSEYLAAILPEKTHAGYFSIDKQNRMTDSKMNNKKEQTSDDVSAFDLIMKDKERLLSFDEPVRFIFSHSALREGWDNPNVFQICTLKNSTNDIRRRQEVGRGLRLSVNQNGDRIDEDFAGNDVQEINELTVIASESYKDFAEGLQHEIEEATGRTGVKIHDTRKISVRARLNRKKLESQEFTDMWEKIKYKSVYQVEFDEAELIRNSAARIDSEMNIPRVMLNIERGAMQREDENVSFMLGGHRAEVFDSMNGTVKHDFVGRLAKLTDLTRKVIANILKSITPAKFGMLGRNPEIFITTAADMINEEKSKIMTGHVKYRRLEEFYDRDAIFDDVLTQERISDYTAETKLRGLYSYVLCDSRNECDFAEKLETCDDVDIFAKLPASFRISTPMGSYNPDWAVIFRDNIYFVAETKGSIHDLQIRPIEKAKISCAREHFREVGNGKVKYEMVNSFQELISTKDN